VKQFAGGIVEDERREYYVHNVTLKIGGWRHENVRVGFMPSLSKHGHGLLGQYGFFDLYSVKFDLPKGEIELKEHGPSPIDDVKTR
jgi:hypothetical protein